MNEAINILPSYTPDYVIDEVQYYFNKINAGKSDCFTLDNAIMLVNLAKINNRVSDEQAKNIKYTTSKIKKIRHLMGIILWGVLFFAYLYYRTIICSILGIGIFLILLYNLIE